DVPVRQPYLRKRRCIVRVRLDLSVCLPTGVVLIAIVVPAERQFTLKPTHFRSDERAIDMAESGCEVSLRPGRLSRSESWRRDFRLILMDDATIVVAGKIKRQAFEHRHCDLRR